MDVLEVVKPGLMTTIQDLGRFTYQQFGLSASGAMDPFALQVANVLVGNRRGEGALEFAMMGPTLRALADVVIALTGADLAPTVDGRSARMWESFVLERGRELSFKGGATGTWTYLAVTGGFDVPLVMGSASTFLRGTLGGFQGRTLTNGDVLECRGRTASGLGAIGKALNPRDIPRYARDATVRVIMGPQQDAFTNEAIGTFLSAPYEVTRQSDRMGYRLAGPALTLRNRADIISDAVAFGSVQVTSDGQPIVLLADRQTTGGYAKIATVITADLPAMAQLKPGARVHFRAVTVREAQDLAIGTEELLRTFEDR